MFFNKKMKNILKYYKILFIYNIFNLILKNNLYLKKLKL